MVVGTAPDPPQPKALTGSTFRHLEPGLYGDTLDTLDAQGFTQTTPVQQATIPLLTTNKGTTAPLNKAGSAAASQDVCVEACTGSGKTLAFVIPVVEILRRLEEPLKKHQVGAVIISPTRELAQQIFAVAVPFAASLAGVQAALLVGGSDPAADVARLRDDGVNLLVGTPGRLEDMFKRCTFLDTKRVEVLVLDEADRLLDMGFKRQLDAIMGRLPKQRRTGLFSATQTDAVEELARAGLRNPIRVTVRQGGNDGGGPAAGPDETMVPSTLKLQYTVVEPSAKPAQLVRFLREHAASKVIVYFLTCACVELYAAVLPKLLGTGGLPVRALHGRLKQAKRESALSDFTGLRAGGCLLCTDVAARGLDIPDVDWVLQYDPPQDPSAFVHRVGRTARMGRSGSALVLLSPTEETYVEFMRLRKVPLVEEGPLPAGGESDSDEGVLAALRSAAEADRDVMDKGTRAFVSYVRGYKEHHCAYIFRHKLLEIGQLARAFALLRLPGMPEVRKAGKAVKACFKESAVDTDTIKFKDKAREKQRAKESQKRAAGAAAAGGGGADAPGGDRSSSKGKNKAKPEKAAAPGKESRKEAEARRENAAQRRKREQREEEDDLEAEYRLLRMVKKGKLTEHQYDVATGMSDASDGEEAAASAEGAAGGSKGGPTTVFGVEVGAGLAGRVGQGRTGAAKAFGAGGGAVQKKRPAGGAQKKGGDRDDGSEKKGRGRKGKKVKAKVKKNHALRKGKKVGR